MKKIFMICIIFIIFILVFNINAKGKNFVDYSSSSIVYDMDDGRIIYKNQIHKKMLPASITKILTCIVAIENCCLNKICIVDKDTISQEGSSIYLKVGEKIKLIDLLYGLMLRSGNDVAYLISVSVCDKVDEFVTLMNKTCKKINMSNSFFNNPSGLDNSNENYTTAYDMALLMRYCMRNETFKTIVSSKTYSCETLDGRKLVFQNKHKLVNSNKYVTGGKTGYTVKAKRTLVTTFAKDDINIVVVTFNCGNDWETHENLFEYTLDNYKKVVLIKKGFIDLGNLKYFATPILYEDVSYLIKNNENVYCDVDLINHDNEKLIILGYARIYVNNKLIKEVKVYRYY